MEQQEEKSVEEGWGPAVSRKVPELVIAEHTGTFDPTQAKILFYGESGTGKTRLASSFPKPLFADIDMGMASVTEKVDRVPVTDFAQLEQLYAWLANEKHEYQTVVLDTLNEMQRLAMHATVEEFPQIRRSYEDLPSMSDYGKMLHDFIELTRKFVLLPMRVVLLAQVTSRQFDTDTVQPQLVGKNSAREVCRKMDVVGYTYKVAGDDGHQRLAVSFDAAEFVTKDRSFKLPASLPDPSFERISAYWR